MILVALGVGLLRPCSLLAFCKKLRCNGAVPFPTQVLESFPWFWGHFQLPRCKSSAATTFVAAVPAPLHGDAGGTARSLCRAGVPSRAPWQIRPKNFSHNVNSANKGCLMLPAYAGNGEAAIEQVCNTSHCRLMSIVLWAAWHRLFKMAQVLTSRDSHIFTSINHHLTSRFPFVTAMAKVCEASQLALGTWPACGIYTSETKTFAGEAAKLHRELGNWGLLCGNYGDASGTFGYIWMVGIESLLDSVSIMLVKC